MVTTPNLMELTKVVATDSPSGEIWNFSALDSTWNYVLRVSFTLFYLFLVQHFTYLWYHIWFDMVHRWFDMVQHFICLWLQVYKSLFYTTLFRNLRYQTRNQLFINYIATPVFFWINLISYVIVPRPPDEGRKRKRGSASL